MTTAEQIDYLAIGHICYDLVPGGRVMGGSAAYASLVAQALGCRTAVLTSAAAEDRWQAMLPGIEVDQVISADTTCFENIYDGEQRRQVLHSVAGRLTTSDVSPAWQRASIVHLAPIANEVVGNVINLFSNSIVGLSPQGWMRRWDVDGRVYAVNWVEMEQMLPLAAVTFISEEDLANPDDLERYVAMTPLLVQTAGAAGCTVFWHGERRGFSAATMPMADPTGAGDSFAAAYLVRLLQTGDPWESARFANAIAGLSVGYRGIQAKMTAIRNHLVAADLN